MGAGPWEKYAQQAPQSAPDADGPWAKYQSKPDTSGSSFDPATLKGYARGAVDALPAIGGVAGGILGTPADFVAGPMGNVAGAAIGGYLGTATKNLINGYFDTDRAPKTLTQTMTQPVVGGVEQGLMQGAGDAVAPIVGKAVESAANAARSASRWFGVKSLSNAFGVKPDVIKEYTQFSDRINSAKSPETLKELSDSVVGKLASDVEAKRLTAEQAQVALKGFQGDLKDAYKTAGYDARDAVTSAQQTLQDAHNARLQQLSGDIYDTVNQLKSDVQSQSGKALDVLNKSNARVGLSDVYDHIDQTIGTLQKSGTDEGQAVADRLAAYKARLMENHGGAVPAPDAKKLIQGLDQITKYSPMAGSFDQAKNAAFKGVRGALDQSLKDRVPEYAAAMMPVAQDASLLNRVQDFGDKQTAVGILGRLDAPNQLERKAALEELGKRYDVGFVNGARQESLPEYQRLQEAIAAKDALRPDRVADKMDQTIAASRQRSAVDAAQSDLGAAQEKLAPLKPLAPNAAGQTSAQSKLEQLGKGDDVELVKMFNRLKDMTGTDFVQAMKDNNTLASFKKGTGKGSTNTVMGALAGYTLGGVGGLAAGGEAGRIVDQWGPAITKKILDGLIKVSKSPTVQTISKLEIPAEVKRNMVVGLENYLARDAAPSSAALVANSGNGQPANRDVASVPQRGESKWAAQGAQNLGIQGDTLQKVMADPKGKQLLIQASDFPPGSRALKNIQAQIQKGWGK